jgi:putative hemolysin
MAFEIAVIVVLVLINGLFSGAEIATVTVRKTRLQQLLAEGKRSAKAVVELRSNPERFLATVQVGITVIGIAAAAYGGDALSERLGAVLAPLPTIGPYGHEIAFVVVVTGLSYFSLVLGELVPKSLALRASEPYALLVARPLLALAQLARPIIWVLTKSSNIVLKLFGDRTSFTEARMSPDELRALLEEAGEGGELHPSVSEIASRALDFADLSAKDIMMPRSAIVAIAKSANTADLRALLKERRHSRVPVYEGTVDNIVGFVAIYDAFIRATDEPLASIVRPITYVPEQMRAVDLLPRLQTSGAEIAVVVDEHGGTAGLLTRIDVAEELFGSVNAAGGSAPDIGIQKEADGSVTVLGTAAVREVNRALDLNLPESDDFATIGGLLISLAGHIPQKGEVLRVENGPTIEVLDASARRVRAVKIKGSHGSIA